MRKHIHKFYRTKYPNGTKIYKCAIPECTTIVLATLIEGRVSVCWRCGEDFVIDKSLKDLKKPHCKNCTKTNKKKDNVASFVDSLLGRS